MKREDGRVLIQAMQAVLVEAGGELEAIEAFRRIKVKTGDERAPLTICLEAGFNPDDVVLLSRHMAGNVGRNTPQGKMPLAMVEIDKVANLAILEAGTDSEHVLTKSAPGALLETGTGSEHVAAALLEKMTNQVHRAAFTNSVLDGLIKKKESGHE